MVFFSKSNTQFRQRRKLSYSKVEYCVMISIGAMDGLLDRRGSYIMDNMCQQNRRHSYHSVSDVGSVWAKRWPSLTCSWFWSDSCRRLPNTISFSISMTKTFSNPIPITLWKYIPRDMKYL